MNLYQFIIIVVVIVIKNKSLLESKSAPSDTLTPLTAAVLVATIYIYMNTDKINKLLMPLESMTILHFNFVN